MTQVYKIQLSMNQAHLVNSGLVFKQGDFGFQIEIEVLDFDVTGVTPQIIFRKSSGAVESTSVTASGNKFTYTMRGTELDTPGPGICDLKLKNSTTQRISTASFRYFVEADTMDGLNEQASSYSDTIAQIVGGFDDEITSLNNSVEQLNDVLGIPTPISCSGTTAWQVATLKNDLSLTKGVPYTFTFAYADPSTAADAGIYCRLTDSNDTQLGQCVLTMAATSNSFTYTPAIDYENAKVVLVIGAVVVNNKDVNCVITSNQDNTVKALEQTLSDITGYIKPNMLSMSVPGSAVNGITYTKKPDGGIHIQGTASALSYISTNITLPTGDYLLNGCNDGSSQTYHIMASWNSGANYVIQTSKDVEISVTEASRTVTVAIRVLAGQVVNADLYPMIRTADVYNPTFAPYGEYQIYKPIQKLINYTEHNWSGQKINVIGDSIVAGGYGNFVNVVRDILCLSVARNYGVGGSCLASSDQDASYPPAVSRYGDMDLDAQIILVHAGTNDYSAQIPLGDDDSTDITTFNGALNVMMSGLREMYPTALIIFDSILHRFNDSSLTIPCSEYRKCIEDRCNANHIVFYDCYKYSGFDFVAGYYDHILTPDGLHPNQKGANILGRKIAGFINWN